VPGVFAAGDVTCVRAKQIIVAAGEGAKAALAAHEYLENERLEERMVCP
jgi:alkyl hydroperoxide reductase subunit F